MKRTGRAGWGGGCCQDPCFEEIREECVWLVVYIGQCMQCLCVLRGLRREYPMLCMCENLTV